MDVVSISASYTLRDRQHDGVVGWIRPCLKIIAIHKDQVRKIFVAIAEVSAKGRRFRGTIRLEGGDPAGRLEDIQHDRYPVCARDSEHVVCTLEVRWVRG